MIALFARLQLLLVSLVSGNVSAGMLSRRRTGSARAITFIEYAILAAIAVAIGLIFRNQLGSLFEQLFARLSTAIDIN